MNHLTQTDRNSAKDFVITTLLFISTIVLFSLEWTNGLAGGVSTVGAERVLAGEIPYRDFWTMYAPGHFYLLALIFYLFGTHLLVEIIAGTVVTAAAASSLFLLARKCGGAKVFAVVTVSVFLAAMFNTGYYRYFGSYPITMFLVFTSLNFLISYLNNVRIRFLFLAGLFLGAAIIIKHDVGIYTTIFTTVGLAACHFIKRGERSDPDDSPSFVSALLVFYAGVALLSVPVYLYFILVAGNDMVRDLVVFPLTDFPLSRPEYYPGVIPRSIRGGSNFKTFVNFAHYLSFNIPLFLTILGIASAVFAYRRRKPVEFALAVTFFVAFVLHYRAAHVQINTHIISLSVYGALLGIVSLQVFGDLFASSRQKKLWGMGAAFVSVWLMALLAAPVFSRYLVWNHQMSVLDLPKVNGLRVESEEADHYRQLAALVNEHVPQGEPIYIGLNRHDALLIGDTRLYFIVDRPSATRYHELHPAITDTQPIQLEMIEDIKNKNVRLIIRKAIFDDEKVDQIKADFLKTLPNIGATELDEYIRDNYHEIQHFGKYSVLLKN